MKINAKFPFIRNYYWVYIKKMIWHRSHNLISFDYSIEWLPFNWFGQWEKWSIHSKVFFFLFSRPEIIATFIYFLILLLPFLFDLFLLLLHGIVYACVCGLFGAMVFFSAPNMLNPKVLLSARGENSNGPKCLSEAMNQRDVDMDHFHLYNTAIDDENYNWTHLFCEVKNEMKRVKNQRKKKR